jgi:hypothetical protein
MAEAGNASMPDIQRCVFAVVDTPYCVWAWDLVDRNLRFLDGIDAGYFIYVAETHLSHIQGEQAQLASVALRAAYHLSLETFFSLIGAALQAPDCVAGWVLKAQTGQIREVVEALRQRRMRFPMKWKVDPAVFGFAEIAKGVLQCAPWAQKEDDETVARFAVLWNRLADDFLDENMHAEYNSIKHGFRARPGRFSLRFGEEQEYGVRPPDEKMKLLGASVFGTSFYSAESVAGAIEGGRDPHFMLRHHSLNWDPKATADLMVLTALSISNLVSFLAVANGRQPGEVKFTRPPDAAAFDEPWKRSVGVTHTNVDSIVSEENIVRYDRERLREIMAPKAGDKEST